VYGSHGERYLKKGARLTDEYIKRLAFLGFNGIYIEDEISDGIEAQDVVNEALRIETVCKVKELYTRSAVGIARKNDWLSLERVLNDIVDEMMLGSQLANNMMDLKQFDDYTFYHCVNVAFLAIATGIGMALRRAHIYELSLGALVHDIGKVHVPLEILNKPGKLTQDEFEIMKTHSEKGYKVLADSGHLTGDACRGVLWHHERYDGNGYPFGKSGDEINLIGKVIAICDVYDAITSDRPYRKAWRPYEAIEYVMGNSSIQFDPGVTQAFLKKVVPYPVGTVVRLSDGRIGIIAENNQELLFRPKIRIFREEGRDVAPYVVDLSADRECLSVTVVEAVNE
jgi:HD-GYP domain-containing protein (c-di-GMP phosphodiesterase class II)